MPTQTVLPIVGFATPTPARKATRVRFTTRRNETWVGKGHHNTRKTGRVTAVRDQYGRFHGATNFAEVDAV